jgi:hypothetical protein
MWHELSQKLSKLVMHRKERGEAFRVRLLLEHLEDRSMLSASIGYAPQMFAPSPMGPWAAAGPRLDAEPALFSAYGASPSAFHSDEIAPQIARTYGDGYFANMSQPLSVSPMLGAQTMPVGMMPIRNDFDTALSSFDAREANDAQGGYLEGLSRSDFIDPYPGPNLGGLRNSADMLPPGLPGTFPGINSSPEGIAESNQPSRGLDSLTLDVITFQDSFVVGIVIADPRGGPSAEVSKGYNGSNPVSQVNGNPGPHLQPGYGSEHDPLLGLIVSAENVLSNEIESSSSIVTAFSREVNSLTSLSSAVHDVALQDFTLRTVNAATTNSVSTPDRATSIASMTDVPADVLEGLLSPTDTANSEDSINATDALAQERSAVDAILHELRDVDATFPAQANAAADSQNGKQAEAIDLVMEASSDEASFGVVDGGMVALQATGDANSSGFDLTPVYAATVAPIKAQLGMETSVGVYQAMDVAIDDAPIADTAQPMQPLSAPNREAKHHDASPALRTNSASNNEAAVLTVTTLTGALVWMNRSRRSAEEADRNEQKRRAV